LVVGLEELLHLAPCELIVLGSARLDGLEPGLASHGAVLDQILGLLPLLVPLLLLGLQLLPLQLDVATAPLPLSTQIKLLFLLNVLFYSFFYVEPRVPPSVLEV